MGFIVLAAFIVVPLIEIGLFIQIGGLIGLWPTIFVVMATAVIGTALLRHQGLAALNRLQHSLNAGEPPLGPIFDGFCLLLAGVLLLTPGFFTDTVGFLLFTPPLRAVLRGYLGRYIKIHDPTKSRSSDGVIDGEWQDVTPQDSPESLPPDRHKKD